MITMPEPIPESLIDQRFTLAGGQCECCKKKLNKAYRGQVRFGAWEAHINVPGTVPTIDTIRIVCSSGLNCHLECCHKGTFNNIPTWQPCGFYHP